jgi:hypothetical protein
MAAEHWDAPGGAGSYAQVSANEGRRPGRPLSLSAGISSIALSIPFHLSGGGELRALAAVNFSVLHLTAVAPL